MSDKGTNPLKTANIRISILVWKLHKAIESAKEQDISFTEVEAIRKYAIDSYKLFLEHGVLDENAHLLKPENRSPRPHSASPNRRQNVRTTPGSEGSSGKRSKSPTRIKERPTHFCDDLKAKLKFEDDETHDCFERNPRKLREFEEKDIETGLENIHLGHELDRVNKCRAELEYQNRYLTCQVDLAEKEMSEASRKEERKYKHLESEVNRYKAEINDLVHRDSNNNHSVKANRYRSERDLARLENKELKTELEKRKDNSLQIDLESLKKILRRTKAELESVKDGNTALRHANENKTKMIEIQKRLIRTEVELKSVKDENTALRHANENKTKIIEEIQKRADEEIKDANDAIVYYKEEQQRYKKAKDENNAQIIKLRTAKEDANGRLAKLTNERDDANRRLAKLTSERDDANRRLAKLKTERDQSNSDAARLKVEKGELLNMLQKQKSSNDAGRHCKDALSNQLHEKDMECKQSKKIVENLNRKLDEIQSQQKEFLKPRDREDLKREENSNRKLVEENEELRNTVFEMEQQINKAELTLENLQTLREENSDLKESLETMIKEMENMEEKYKKETAIRICTDGTTTKLKDENDRLRKERNKAKYDVNRIMREKEELAHELRNEIDAAKVEHDNLKKDKNELASIYEQKGKRDKEKIDQLEKELKTLVARNTSGEKTTQHNAYELLHLKNDYTVCKQQKILLEEDLLGQRQEITEFEKRIKDLESRDQRCTRCDQYERTLAKLKKENQELQDRNTSVEKATQHNAYELLQLKNDYAVCKQQRTLLEEDLLDQRQEITEFEKKIKDLESRDKRCTKCDQHERALAKLKRQNQELQDRNTSGEKTTQHNAYELLHLKNDYAVCKQQKILLEEDLLGQRQEITELEKRIKDLDSKNQACAKCDQYERTLAKLKKENQELQDRLSVAVEKHVEEQVPFIGNLCDINRPTALADKFCSLYTDEYTDAMEVIERSMDEAGAVHVMLEWLKSCNDWCERLAREQIDLLTTESIGFMNKYHGEKIDFVIPDKCHILVRELQRQIADNTLAAVRKICHAKSVKQKNLMHNSYIVKYIQRCSELCWRMQITNPPMCLKFDVKNGENLDKTLYNAFAKNGSRIEYLVWPILFLHKSGPLMAKGVAQGT